MGGQADARLVGTWKLVSVTSTDDAGQVNEAVHGLRPSGRLTDMADGRMALVIAEDPREPLSVDNKVASMPNWTHRDVVRFVPARGRSTPAANAAAVWQRV